MDQILSTQFDRLEKALGTLIDSIAAYNPSPQGALDLVLADDELSQGLDQLARHQTNHARIQSLRTEAEALEDQLKTSVSALASLRHELFETPATTFPADSRPVRFDELLQYARSISRHTVPPTYRERAPQAAADKDKEKDDAASAGAPTNGVNTPAHVPDAMDTSGVTPEPPKEGDVPGSTPLDITAEEEEWLKKLKDSKIAWYPWPSEDKIRTGNLYKLMYWQAKGMDLDEFDVNAAEEAKRVENEPVEEIKNPELEAAIQAAQVQQPAPAPRAPQPARPIFTGFADLDDPE